MSNKAIFLDRDDTLIEDPGYISSPDQVKLLSGTAGALIKFKAMGYKLVVVTNQSAVARGIVTEKVLREIHNRMEQLLAQKDASLDGIYYCPYHSDGVIAKYRKESDWAKPNPGMLQAAADEMDIDLGQSWMIGNSSRDIEAGLRAGCKTILIDSPSRQKESEPGDPTPNYKAVNITEAANIIKKYHRRPDDSQSAAEPPPTDQTEPASEPPEPAPEDTQPVPQEPEPVSQNAKPLAQTQQPQSQQDDLQTDAPEQKNHTESTEQLLSRILDQLKSMQRSDMFDEFSIMRFIAGIVQMLVLLCLLITIWLLMSPNRQDTSVLIALGFAVLLQIMSLTFYTMQERK